MGKLKPEKSWNYISKSLFQLFQVWFISRGLFFFSFFYRPERYHLHVQIPHLIPIWIRMPSQQPYNNIIVDIKHLHTFDGGVAESRFLSLFSPFPCLNKCTIPQLSQSVIHSSAQVAATNWNPRQAKIYWKLNREWRFKPEISSPPVVYVI